jgi:hypothetical protein
MAATSSAMAGDPPPYGWYGWPMPYGVNYAPEPRRAWEAALIGPEEHYTVGIFQSRWEARKAAARAMRSYRRYYRDVLFGPDEDGEWDRGMRRPMMRPIVTEHSWNEYEAPWWEEGQA